MITDELSVKIQRIFRKINEECKKNGLESEHILVFILTRSAHYAEKLGIEQERIVELWEEKRNFYIPNYYQDSNFPTLDDSNTVIVSDMDEFKKKFPKLEYKCPQNHLIKNATYCMYCDMYAMDGLFNFGQVKVISIADFERVSRPERIFRPVEMECQNQN